MCPQLEGERHEHRQPAAAIPHLAAGPPGRLGNEIYAPNSHAYAARSALKAEPALARNKPGTEARKPALHGTVAEMSSWTVARAGAAFVGVISLSHRVRETRVGVRFLQ